MAEFLKRTWAQIRLSAIEQNYRAVRGLLAEGCRVMAVVKADAYGHGDVQVATVLQNAGAEWFGVSNLEEAIRLREADIVRPILILSYTPPEEAARLARYDITQSVIDGDYARRLSAAATAAGVTVAAHIKLDTGMSRVGFFYHDEDSDRGTIDELQRVCALQNLAVDGIFTHFAAADEEDGEAFTRRQYALFMNAITELENRGVRFALKHCCNSAATLRFPEMHLDMVRPGIVLYGPTPSAFLSGRAALTPAMTLKTVVSQVKTVPAGTEVSYGRTFVTARPTTVATVPIGYADGYPRLLSGKARMLIGGHSAPLIGRICMDQCVLDVTDIPNVREGMTVTVFGEDGGTVLPADELAALSGTIHYEVICCIGKRVPRVFYENEGQEEER